MIDCVVQLARWLCRLANRLLTLFSRGSLGPFVATDSFLRHVARERCIRAGLVTWEAFSDRHDTLSFTFQNDQLRTPTGLDRYHRTKALPSGDLPGLCKLSFHDLTVSLEPPHAPRHDPISEDEEYGHLHCCTDPPRDQEHCEKMAKLATRNGVVREFVRHKKTS